MLENTLESPLDCKETQPVHPKGNQSWVFIRRTDAEAETPILWPANAKSWIIWKDPDAGKDLKAGGEGDERGWDDRMASQTQWTRVWASSGSWWTKNPGGCGPWVRKESDTTELNWTCGSAGKESTCNAGDLGLIPRLGRSLREAKGYPLKYSGMENSMDYIVHRYAKSQTWLSKFHFHRDHWKTERTCNNRNQCVIPIPKKGNAKECSNYCTVALISHASKVMLKILQARLQ